MRDKNGKEAMITRWVDEDDQLKIVGYFSNIVSISRIYISYFQISECGKAKVNKLYKRVQQI